MKEGEALGKLSFTFILLSLILFGCTGQNSDSGSISSEEDETSKMSNETTTTADAEGIIIDKTEKSITIVWNVNKTDFSKSKREILEIAKPNALTVSYSETNDLAIGDKISIWTTGAYDDSYPRQGVATNIKLIAKHEE